MRSIQRFRFVPILIAATLVFAAAVVSPDRALSQGYTLEEESEVWVDGTSNKSDWTVHATEIEASADIDDESGVPSSMQITMASAAIKSNKSTIMDRLMHDALKVSEHPAITYELVDAALGDDGITLSTNGNLTLAGVTREIDMDVTMEKVGDGIRYTGSTPLKMSDFEMRPPTAMFGALRTGDDVTVGFDVVFASAGSTASQ